MEAPNLFRETWSVNFKWHWEIAVCACTDTSDFRLAGTKKFL